MPTDASGRCASGALCQGFSSWVTADATTLHSIQYGVRSSITDISDPVNERIIRVPQTFALTLSGLPSVCVAYGWYGTPGRTPEGGDLLREWYRCALREYAPRICTL